MNNKEILSKNLKRELDYKNLTPTEFARIMKYPETTVFNWIHGKSYPRIDKIQEMADFFEIYKSDLTEDKNKHEQENTNKFLTNEEKEILEPYNQLNNEGKNKSVEYTWDLVASNKYEKTETVEIIGGAAAGNGFNYIDEITSNKIIPKKQRPTYDMIIPVEGDSMEPKIHDGSLAFIRVSTDYDNGKIYVVDADGKVYIKQVYFDNREIVLKSINPSYEDIHIEDLDTFRVIGEVVDWE